MFGGPLCISSIQAHLTLEMVDESRCVELVKLCKNRVQCTAWNTEEGTLDELVLYLLAVPTTRVASCLSAWLYNVVM